MVSKIKEMSAWVGVVFMIAVGVFFGGRRSAKKDIDLNQAKKGMKGLKDAKKTMEYVQSLDDSRIIDEFNRLRNRDR